jgi:hypothetical protein
MSNNGKSIKVGPGREVHEGQAMPAAPMTLREGYAMPAQATSQGPVSARPGSAVPPKPHAK